MSRRSRTTRAAGKITAAVLVSRVLGLVREQVFAKLFGAGLYNDAWQVAFRIPNLLRDLFAEGALSAAFVPTFTEEFHKRGRSQAWLLANLTLSALSVVLGVFTILLLLFPELFVHLLAAGFREVPGKVDITSRLVQILAPFLLFVAAAAVAMGILNTLGHYFLPALAPAIFNVCLILAGFLLVPVFDARGILPIHAMAVGAIGGGLLQFLFQLPTLYGEGYRFQLHFDFRHEGLRRIGRLLAPAVLGAGATQFNVLVNTQLASFLGNGPVSWLNYAFRILYLPIGMFGVAVGVTNLREVSADAAAERWEDFKETVANSVKLVSFLAIPSAFGLIVLSVPIVRLLFERGSFGSEDTLRTAYALMAYSAGLWAYSCIKVYVPSFYALEESRTPVRASLIAVSANLVVNIALILTLPDPFRFVGLAFGTAASVTLNNALLAMRFRARMGSLSRYSVASNLLRITLASIVMGIAVWNLFAWLEGIGFGGGAGTFGQLARLGVAIAAGLIVYLVCCRLLGVEEVSRLRLRSLRRNG